MTELPWVEKYRPNCLDDLVARDDVVQTSDLLLLLKSLPISIEFVVKRLTSQSFFPNLLLFGPPGTGKTSAVLAVAQQLYGNDMKKMILELNASDDRGINVVREKIQDAAKSTSLTLSEIKFKLIILDECDNMTKDAQMALRRIMEDFTKNVRFCLMCNQPNRLLPAIRSRCAQLRFPPLQQDLIKERLYQIVRIEGMNIDEEGIDAMIRVAEGDMRVALNTLQFLHMTGDRITSKEIYEVTGKPSEEDIRSVVQELLNSDLATAFGHISDIRITKVTGTCISSLFNISQGIALHDLVEKVAAYLMEQCEFPDTILMKLLLKMGDCESRLCGSPNEDLQLFGLIGTFIKAREGMINIAT